MENDGIGVQAQTSGLCPGCFHFAPLKYRTFSDGLSHGSGGLEGSRGYLGGSSKSAVTSRALPKGDKNGSTFGCP